MAEGKRLRLFAARREPPLPDVRTLARRGSATVRLRALSDIARIAWSPASEPFLHRLGESALTALDAASISLCVWEPEHGRVRCLVNVGELGPGEEQDPVDEFYSLDDYGPLGMLLEAQLGWVADVEHGRETDPSIRLLNELGKCSGLSVPIPGQGRVWGELYATRTAAQKPFSETDLDFAVAVGAQVGAALVTAEHLRSVERQLHLDPVTGLAGRGEVEDRIDAALASWNAEQIPVSLVMLDLVGLRELASVEGRATSDQVVRRCAGLVSKAAGRAPGALAGRFDGDRFCVLIQGRPADEAVQVAEQLVHEARRLLPLDVACGVAATDDVTGPIPTRDRLVRLVEAAQSRARQTGGLVPVVAGRTLPSLALVGAAVGSAMAATEDGPGIATTPGIDPTQRLLRICLDLVDDAGPAVTDRLVALSTALCRHVDGLGWWVSRVDDEDIVQTVEYARYRLTASMATHQGEVWSDDGYPLADYPCTSAAVSGESFLVEASDPTADAAELAILDGMSVVAMLGSGGVGADGGRWLVEVYADALSLPLGEVAPVLRALIRYALHPAAPTTAHGPLAGAPVTETLEDQQPGG